MKSYFLLVLVGVLLVGTSSNSSKSRQKRFLLLRKLIQMNREIGEQMDGINNQTPAPKSCPSYSQPVQYEQTTYYNNPPSQQEYYTTPSYNSQDYYTTVPPPAYNPTKNNYISSPPNYKEPPIPSYVQMSSSYISVSPDYIPEQNYPPSPILGQPQSSYQSPTIPR